MDAQQKDQSSPRTNSDSNDPRQQVNNADHLEKREKLWWAEHEVPDTSRTADKERKDKDREE